MITNTQNGSEEALLMDMDDCEYGACAIWQY
jgi:hypothetical protein